MAKSINAGILAKNQKGQSLVEYILLLAVLSSIAFAFFNNKRFKDFMAGTDGFFMTLKKGMSYSYRYGTQYKNTTDFDAASSFEYGSASHDLYFNKTENASRFFTGNDPYP